MDLNFKLFTLFFIFESKIECLEIKALHFLKKKRNLNILALMIFWVVIIEFIYFCIYKIIIRDEIQSTLYKITPPFGYVLNELFLSTSKSAIKFL